MNKSYLESEKEKFFDLLKEDMDDANECFREVSKQLILVATVIISFSAFAFEKEVTEIQKYVISSLWLFLLLSINFGIIQFIEEYQHSRKWGKARAGVIEDIDDGIANDENLVLIYEKYHKDLKSESKVWAFYAQIISMTVSLILLFLFVLIRMFW